MRTYQIVLGGMVLATYTAAVALDADAQHAPHTLVNAFGIVYTTTGFGISAQPLVMSEVVEFLRDVIGPNAPVAPTTFKLA
jgi:hypothetical protein